MYMITSSFFLTNSPLTGKPVHFTLGELAERTVESVTYLLQTTNVTL